MTYKHLLFDLDHTLLDFDLSEELALTQLFTERGVTDLSAYKAAYQAINKQLWRDLEQGLVSKKELVETRFAKTFAQFGQTVDGVDLARHYESCLGHQGDTYPGAQELLRVLQQRGYKLYAATNGITAIQTARLSVSGLSAYFDAVFISEELGFPKPDRRFFATIAEQIEDFSAQKTLMIGDNQIADIKGASDFGLATAFYNPNQVPLIDGVQPTYTVASYQELLELL